MYNAIITYIYNVACIYIYNVIILTIWLTSGKHTHQIWSLMIMYIRCIYIYIYCSLKYRLITNIFGARCWLAVYLPL